MSLGLSLIQGYSSSEEDHEEQEDEHSLYDDLRRGNDSSEDDELDGDPSAAVNRSIADRSFFDLPQPSAAGLPSAFEAFSEVSAPPGFLNNSVEEYGRPKRELDQPIQYHHHHRRHTRRKHNKDKKDLPAGAVMESKAHLVGIHERVRSDVEGNVPAKSVPSKAEPEGKRIITAANPNAEDAADLLRMCLQCGIPKTFTNAKGMVCPVCGDRPPADPSSETKKKGSAVKDKEKNKRMKGQSSHATWKSETEMHLRQQFD